MGLLDDILAQVGGGAQNEPPPRTDAGTTSSGMAPLLTALMPVVLAMLAGNDNRAGALPINAPLPKNVRGCP